MNIDKVSKVAINCRNYYNAECVKCNQSFSIMIEIGAFVMCVKCWKEEFNGVKCIDGESDLYKIIYAKWYEKYM